MFAFFDNTLCFRTLSRLIAIVIALQLTACATQKSSAVADAATAPFSDLNLVQVDIPPLLIAAQSEPYGLAVDASCLMLSAQIAELDEVLGPDIDAPKSKREADLLEQGSDEAGNAAIGALRRTTEGVIPFRGWVRKLTGADRYARKVSAATMAGVVRRGFLKGVRTGMACPTPNWLQEDNDPR